MGVVVRVVVALHQLTVESRRIRDPREVVRDPVQAVRARAGAVDAGRRTSPNSVAPSVDAENHCQDHYSQQSERDRLGDVTGNHSGEDGGENGCRERAEQESIQEGSRRAVRFFHRNTPIAPGNQFVNYCPKDRGENPPRSLDLRAGSSRNRDAALRRLRRGMPREQAGRGRRADQREQPTEQEGALETLRQGAGAVERAREVRCVAKVARSASPREPPTCRDVFTRPEASPASPPATPEVAAMVTGTNEKPMPIAASSDGRSTSRRYVPSG